MIINSKKWDTFASTQIADSNHIKGLSKWVETFKNCIVRFKILVLTSKICNFRNSIEESLSSKGKIVATQEHIESLNLCLKLCSVRWLEFKQKRVSNFKLRGSDTEKVGFPLIFLNLVQ